uniref:Signal peptidase complex subunit 1 n=1 Tax=Plectus sambesii TaxID=2011161 RepID=A0A914WXL6_9BILA
MDGLLNMLPESVQKISSYMDFNGQKNAERIFQVLIVLHGIIGFVAGFITQQLSIAVYILGFGFLLSCLVILPPWPYFRSNPIKWHPVTGAPAVEKVEKKKKK